MYQTVGPDGKVQNKVRRVFKKVDDTRDDKIFDDISNQKIFKEIDNTGIEPKQESFPAIESCKEGGIKKETLESLKEQERVLKSPTEGATTQVLQVFRSVGPDGIVRNKVRRVSKKREAKEAKEANSNDNVDASNMKHGHHVVNSKDRITIKADEKQASTNTLVVEPDLEQMEMEMETEIKQMEELSEMAVEASPCGDDEYDQLLEGEGRINSDDHLVDGDVKSHQLVEVVDGNFEKGLGRGERKQVVRFSEDGQRSLLNGDGVQFLHQLRMQVSIVKSL